MPDVRSSRAPVPVLPDIPVEIPAPPAYPDPSEQNLWLTILPSVAIGSIVLLGVVVGGGTASIFVLITPIMLGVLAGVTVYAQRLRRRSLEERKETIRIGYLRSLNYKRARLQAAHDAYRALLDISYPPSDAVLMMINQRTRTLQKRHPSDHDFASVRIGLATLPSPVRITVPDPDRDHPLLGYALSLAEDYRTLKNAPCAIKLTEGVMGLAGARPAVLDLMRAILIPLALQHTPADLRIHVVAPAERTDDWRWVEWLPHASTVQRGGAADLVALGVDNVRSLSSTLGQSLNERRESATRLPFLLLIVDSQGLPHLEALRTILSDGTALGASAIVLAPSADGLPGDCVSVITLGPEQRMRCALLAAGTELTGTADAISAADAERGARSLAASMTDMPDAGRLPRTVEFFSLYGADSAGDLVGQIAFRWRGLIRGGQLPRPVPIGMEGASSPVELALAEGQHGPHGMVAGTTGSGKSELLQSLICALAIEHDPRLVNFLLIDFKGGSTFGQFSRLPHTVGLVTNLDGALIERVLAALKGEMTARQAALRALDLRDITQYHRQYTSSPAQMVSPSYRPLAHLFVIVDEFAQLARDFPDFLAELVRVAQLGRSLGLHLILGTQSPMEVVTEEMAANLQFRICLRVQSIEASRAVLRRPDAAYLPADWPGRAYLQVGERGVFRQFQTAHAGADYLAERAEPEEMTLELLAENGTVIDLLDDTQPMDEDPLLPHTVARAVVDTILDYAQLNDVPFMPPLLLPPLGEAVPLRTAFTIAGVTGWNSEGWPTAESHGAAPVGLSDDVGERKQAALWLDLHTNTLVTGAPGSGKTSALWTFALGLSLITAPDDLHLYALSLTNSLDELDCLPHVQLVSGADPERVHRLFRRLLAALEARQAGADSTPLIGLLIDGFEAFRDAYYDAHLADIERLISEGRSHGIAVVITATSISALPERLRALISRRIALRPAHPSEWGMAVGTTSPRSDTILPPGRGVVSGSPPLSIQICLPCEFPAETVVAGLRETGAEMRAVYRQMSGREHAPLPVRRLPTRVRFEDGTSMPSNDDTRQKLTRGGNWPAPISSLGIVDDDAQSPLLFDWENDGPHVVIAGSARSGKTNLLHAAALSLAAAVSPEAVQIMLVDLSGRSLRALAELPHALHITDPQLLDLAVHELSTTTIRTAIFIDDYDLAADILNSEGGTLLRALRDIVRIRSETYVWAAGYLDRASDPLIRHLLLKRTGFAFGGRDGLNALGLRTLADPNSISVPGRAVYAQDNRQIVVQTSLVDDVQKWVVQITGRWGESRHSKPSPAAHNANPAPSAPLSYDIDTRGLIDDLFGDSSG